MSAPRGPRVVLGLDTATAATAVAVAVDGEARERRDDPAAGARPAHAARLLGLAVGLLAEAGLQLADVDRIGVGIGPGSFTGLRIGVATARALAQGAQSELVGVGSLRALALGTPAEAGNPVLAVLDAGRGEVFAAAYREGEELLAPRALGPSALRERAAGLGLDALAVGPGALRFALELEAAGVAVAPAGSPWHRLDARCICAAAAAGSPTARDRLRPDYGRPPDAQERKRP